MRIVYCGGASGGHVYPAIAIMKAIEKRVPRVQSVFVGTADSIEESICTRENLPFLTIPSRPIKRKFSFDIFKTLLTVDEGMQKSIRLLRSVKPDLVIGTGGYVAGPFVFQAAANDVPTLIHEQNAYPSLTNRILGLRVDVAALTFDESRRHLPWWLKKYTLGNPIRTEFLSIKREQGISDLNLNPDLKTLLVVQGSLGSATINELFIKALPSILADENLQVVFVTGQKHYEHVETVLKDKDIWLEPRLKVEPYLFNIGSALAAADLIISRAGGMIAEINAMGLPAIYIPSPYVAENHQEHNARAIENQGAAVMLREKELDANLLINTILSLINDEEKMASMKERALRLARPEAADDIADLALKLLRKEL